MDRRAPLLVLGAVRAVTSLIRASLRATLAGVRKRPTLDHSLVCLHTRVVRLAHGLARDVRILVTRLVMLVHVRLVLLWARPRIVFAAVIRRKSAVRIPIMKMDGVVVRSVVSCCPVENIHARFHVTRDYVVAVRLALMLVAIVEKCRQRCCVSRKMMRRIVELCAMTAQRMNGPAALAAERPVTVHLTAANIHARRNVIHKIPILRIVRAHQMSLSIAPVTRHRYLRSRDISLGPHAKILS